MGDKVHLEEIQGYPQWLIDEYVKLCDWARETMRRYRGRVLVRIIDNQSVNGFWRMLRYRFRKTPTFLFEGQKFVGWEAEPRLQEALRARLAGGAEERSRPASAPAA